MVKIVSGRIGLNRIKPRIDTHRGVAIILGCPKGS